MKTKLTKNDSMPVKQTDFDVLVAAFETILKQKKAHQSFFEEWSKYRNYRCTANTFDAWRESIKIDKPSTWLMSAFIWVESKDGAYYWKEIQKEWISWLKANLNK